MKGGIYWPKGRKTYRVWFPWRGKKIFINRYLDGSKLHHEEQARRVLEKIRAEVDQGVFDPANWGKDRSVFGDAAKKRYLQQSEAKEARKKEIERDIEEFILPYMKKNNLAINDIQLRHVQDMCAGISEDYEPSTRRRKMATIRAFFNFHQMKFIYPKIKIPKKSIEWLTIGEQQKVVQCVPPQHQPIIRFLITYGCRASEACNLRREDVDLEKQVITFKERKNDQDNAVAIPEEAKLILKNDKVTNLEYVFCTATGKKYNHQMLYYIWTRASKKAGVKVMPLKNGTRHSLASQLLEAGESPVAVSRILGNSPGVVMRYYGNISVEKTREILRKRIGE